MCGQYNQQVVDFQDGMRVIRDNEDEILKGMPPIGDEGMQRIREKLSNPSD